MRFVFVVALLAVSAPALAQQGADAPEKKADAEKKICRSVMATGSIMGKRECHTKAEWAAITQQSVQAREKLDRDYGHRTGGIGVSGN